MLDALAPGKSSLILKSPLALTAKEWVRRTEAILLVRDMDDPGWRTTLLRPLKG